MIFESLYVSFHLCAWISSISKLLLSWASQHCNNNVFTAASSLTMDFRGIHFLVILAFLQWSSFACHLTIPSISMFINIMSNTLFFKNVFFKNQSLYWKYCVFFLWYIQNNFWFLLQRYHTENFASKARIRSLESVWGKIGMCGSHSF